MKLIYLAQIGLFDDWAHTVQIMKMCEAFAENGVEVELVIPRRRLIKKDDTFKYYNIRPIFKITRVPFVDFFYGSPSAVWYWVRFVSFLVSSRVYLLFRDYDVLYTREFYVAPFFRNVFVERHSFPKLVRDIHHFIFRVSFGLVVLTSFIKSKLVGMGVNPDKILVAPDAVRMEDFSLNMSVVEARKKLSLSGVDKVFGYVGTLRTMGMEKGVATAIEALMHLPANYKLYVVGGEAPDIQYYKSYAQTKRVAHRVVFAGKVSHKDVPLYIASCDVLVAPFPQNEHYSYYMSPLKIFEYMASSRPMVVSDLPSLREVLTEGETALFARPGHAESLASAVKCLITDSSLSHKIAQNARRVVAEKYTWQKRAERILEFIQ